MQPDLIHHNRWHNITKNDERRTGLNNYKINKIR